MMRAPLLSTLDVRRNRISRGVALKLVLSHCALLVALAISLSWNLKQARRRDDEVVLAYRGGFQECGERIQRALIRAQLQIDRDEPDQEPEPEREGL